MLRAPGCPHRHALALHTFAAACVAAVLLSAGSARAEGVGIGGGGYVSFVFGDRLGFGWGAEGWVIPVLTGEAETSCSSKPRAGVGGTLQLGAINLETMRIVAAVQGGTELGERAGFGVLGEVGVAVHLFDDPRVGVHNGFVFVTPLLVDTFV